MAHIQTVRGPVAPSDVGFTLPHEHTRCVLWHVPNRWDYWQLTGEDEVIVPELARNPRRLLTLPDPS